MTSVDDDDVVADDVRIYELQWHDVLLLILVVLALRKLIQMVCCRHRRHRDPAAHSVTTAWRSDLLIVLQRPLARTAVHVDVVRLVDRVRLDGAAFANVEALLTALLRRFDPARCDQVLPTIRAQIEPVATSPDFMAVALGRLFHSQAPLFEQLRATAVLRASVNQGVLAPPFIVLRQRFASATEAQLSGVRFRNEPRSWSIDIFSADDADRHDPVRVEHRRVFECDFFAAPDAPAPALSFTFVLHLSIALRGDAFDEFGIECRTSDLQFSTPCSDQLRRRIAELTALH
jgi:hypothetical protein